MHHHSQGRENKSQSGEAGISKAHSIPTAAHSLTTHIAHEIPTPTLRTHARTYLPNDNGGGGGVAGGESEQRR